jgi:hypothetical protein
VESNGLSGELGFIELLVKCSRREIGKTCLLALPVIKDLDIFSDGLSGLSACGEALVMQEFVFERASEAFHWGVVVAVALAAHGHRHAKLLC